MECELNKNDNIKINLYLFTCLVDIYINMPAYYGIDFNQLINNNIEYTPKYIFEQVLYDVKINLPLNLTFIIKYINADSLILFGIPINDNNIDNIITTYNSNKDIVLKAIDNIIYSKAVDFVDICNLNTIRDMVELSEFFIYNISHS